jgi:hypothetical protein
MKLIEHHERKSYTLERQRNELRNMTINEACLLEKENDILREKLAKMTKQNYSLKGRMKSLSE